MGRINKQILKHRWSLCGHSAEFIREKIIPQANAIRLRVCNPHKRAENPIYKNTKARWINGFFDMAHSRGVSPHSAKHCFAGANAGRLCRRAGNPTDINAKARYMNGLFDMAPRDHLNTNYNLLIFIITSLFDIQRYPQKYPQKLNVPCTKTKIYHHNPR